MNDYVMSSSSTKLDWKKLFKLEFVIALVKTYNEITYFSLVLC